MACTVQGQLGTRDSGTGGYAAQIKPDQTAPVVGGAAVGPTPGPDNGSLPVVGRSTRRLGVVIAQTTSISRYNVTDI